MWSAASISLSGVACHGLADRAEVRIAPELPQLAVNGWCEIMLVSAEAERSIREYREA